MTNIVIPSVHLNFYSVVFTVQFSFYFRYYCTLGAVIPNPEDGVTGNICPAGSYCDVGTTTPDKCPIGTFNPVEGEQFETTVFHQLHFSVIFVCKFYKEGKVTCIVWNVLVECTVKHREFQNQLEIALQDTIVQQDQIHQQVMYHY